MKCHAGHIEVAVARLIGFRTHTIVPNVSWGLGLRHECDMLVLDSQNRFTEVEIKTTLSDLKADFKKIHGHQSKIISRLIYAMPKPLFDKHGDLVPDGCGAITVKYNEHLGKYEAQWEYQARHDKYSRPTQMHILKFMSLGCMRIWSLKEKNNGNLKQL